MDTSVAPDETPLPFPHGIEMELQVIRRDGVWISGEDILKIFDEIVSQSKNRLEERVSRARVRSVREKYQHSSQTEEGTRGSRIIVRYRDPAGDYRDFTLLGHDPNVTSLTWILEVATPPCTTVEELAWWTQTLLAVAHEALPAGQPVILISTGLNPTQEYLRNLSFGEHHHILGPSIDMETRLAVYNMIRNFLPHLIALTVNSPFEKKRPTDEVGIDDRGRLRAPRCKRSIRLLKNTTQLGPTNAFEFIPYMTGPDKEFFARHVNRSPARMVDIYPFTDYETIEIRMFDSQLSVPRRIAVALLLQALALKAKRMVERGERVPDVGAETLTANRESAIAAGLWGPFYTSKNDVESEFIRMYNHSIDDNGDLIKDRPNRFLSEAIVSMLCIIREEIEELRLVDSPFMQPLFVTIFGSEQHAPRTTGADFQLEVYAKAGQNMVVLMKKLAEITRECCSNWLYDPLGGTPNLPTWLCWWTGLRTELVASPERVFVGQDAEFVFILRNASKRDMTDLMIDYRIEDLKRNPVTRGTIPIPNISQNEELRRSVRFRTLKNVDAYNMLAKVLIAGREINITGTINTYWIKASVRASSTVHPANGVTPVQFAGELETNFPAPIRCTCCIEVVPQDENCIFAKTCQSLTIEPGEKRLVEHSQFPPLIIPAGTSEGVERCLLRMALLNETGDVIDRFTGRPFYVSFVAAHPQILLRTDVQGAVAPGQVINGEIELKPRGQTLSPNAYLKIELRTASDRTYAIRSIRVASLINGATSFQSTVPMLEQGDTEGFAVICAALVDNDTQIAVTESQPFRISLPETVVRIESFKAPEVLTIGERVTGWLRIRYNHAAGDTAELVMSLRTPEPDGRETTVLRQPIKSLSYDTVVKYGPFAIPINPGEPIPEFIDLTATIFYRQELRDSKTVHIRLRPPEITRAVDMEFGGLPEFVEPNSSLEGTLSITNRSSTLVMGRLEVIAESDFGTSTILQQNIVLSPDENRIFPVSLHIPLSAERSTWDIVARLDSSGESSEEKWHLRVKDIDAPICEVSFELRSEAGKEIPNLVPRNTPILIFTHVRPLCIGIQDLSILIRLMSKRNVIFESRHQLDFSHGEEQHLVFKWITTMNGTIPLYYIDIVLYHMGRPLPQRAWRTAVKTFTVY